MASASSQGDYRGSYWEKYREKHSEGRWGKSQEEGRDTTSASSYGSSIRREAEAIRRRGGDRRKGGGAYRGPERRWDFGAGSDSEFSNGTRRAMEPAVPRPQNVMELLVEEEIEVQLMNLGVQQRMEIHVPQVMAYALNRLPCLYVTSERGWRRQWIQGKSVHQKEIVQAVRQAIVAVQRDPLRTMGPLSEHLPEAAEIPMAQLRKMLQEPHLTWSTLVPTIQKLLVEGKMDFPDEVAARTAKRTAHKKAQQAEQATHTQTGEPEQPFKQIEADGFDWDHHPLHQRGY